MASTSSKSLSPRSAWALLAAVVLSTAVTLYPATQAAAAPKTEVAVIPDDPSSLTVLKDQVSLSVSVVDGTNYEDHKDVWGVYEFDGKKGSPVRFKDVVCQLPFFQVVVRNESDQTLKLRSSASGSNDEVIVAIDDDREETTTALRKSQMMESAALTYKRFTGKLAKNPTEATSVLMAEYEAVLRRLKFLSDDTTVLPGRKAKFYTCFEYVPGASDQDEVNGWFKDRKKLTLGFYDVPVQRDAAGNPAKKTSYQFGFNVAFKEN